jgi:hypothetical protein
VFESKSASVMSFSDFAGNRNASNKQSTVNTVATSRVQQQQQQQASSAVPQSRLPPQQQRPSNTATAIPSPQSLPPRTVNHKNNNRNNAATAIVSLSSISEIPTGTYKTPTTTTTTGTGSSNNHQALNVISDALLQYQVRLFYYLSVSRISRHIYIHTSARLAF